MTQPTRPTEDIRRRLLAGEPLTTAQVVADYGVSNALLHAAMKAMRNDGCTFQSETLKEPGTPARYMIESPAPKRGLRSTWGPGEGVVSMRKKPRKGDKKPRKQRSDKGQARGSSAVAQAHGELAATARVLQHANGNGNGSNGMQPTPDLAHPVPVLGESVQVYLLMLDEDGRVNVGLRSAESAWLVGVDGFAKR